MLQRVLHAPTTRVSRFGGANPALRRGAILSTTAHLAVLLLLLVGLQTRELPPDEQQEVGVAMVFDGTAEQSVHAPAPGSVPAPANVPDVTAAPAAQQPPKPQPVEEAPPPPPPPHHRQPRRSRPPWRCRRHPCPYPRQLRHQRPRYPRPRPSPLRPRRNSRCRRRPFRCPRRQYQHRAHRARRRSQTRPRTRLRKARLWTTHWRNCARCSASPSRRRHGPIRRPVGRPMAEATRTVTIPPD